MPPRPRPRPTRFRSAGLWQAALSATAPRAPSGTTRPASRRHLVLIDGSGFLYRAYYALPPLCRSDGTPIGAVYGFTNMLSKFIAQIRADMIAVLFDMPGPGFRHRLYPHYKAQRPTISPALAVQVSLVREATHVFGLRPIEVAGFEADDLIATYARLGVASGARVTIVSSDKDLMQLVGEQVRMLDPITGRDIGPAEVREKFGVRPQHVADVQALCGDPIDNVPGVPGIGVKTAAELINAYGDLDTLFAHLAEIMPSRRRQALIQFEYQARLSQALVTLKDDVPPPCPLSDLAVRPPDPRMLSRFLQEMEFRALTVRVMKRLSMSPGAVRP